MKGFKRLSGMLVLLMLTACASGAHKTVYYEYRRPAQHVSVQATVHRYQPIEVTLYADLIYGGPDFTTVHLVIADGDYVEIPMKNRRGHNSRIFAHYHEGVLHFDADRNCHGIQGASRFKHDNGWHNGQMYTKINAGKDFDLSGLRLKVRNVDHKQPPVVAQKHADKENQNTQKTPPRSNANNKGKSVVKNKRVIEKKQIVLSKPDKAKSSHEVVSKNETTGRNHVAAEKPLKNSRASIKPTDNKPSVAQRYNRPAEREKPERAVAKNEKLPKQRIQDVNQPKNQNVHVSKNETRQLAGQKNVPKQKNQNSSQLNEPRERNQKAVEKPSKRNQADSSDEKRSAEEKQTRKPREDKTKKNDKNEDEDEDENSSNVDDHPGKSKKQQTSRKMK